MPGHRGSGDGAVSKGSVPTGRTGPAPLHPDKGVITTCPPPETPFEVRFMRGAQVAGHRRAPEGIWRQVYKPELPPSSWHIKRVYGAQLRGFMAPPFCQTSSCEASPPREGSRAGTGSTRTAPRRGRFGAGLSARRWERNRSRAGTTTATQRTWGGPGGGTGGYLSVLVVNHNVVWFDVAVHHAHAVAVIQRLRTQRRRHRGGFGAGGAPRRTDPKAAAR